MTLRPVWQQDFKLYFLTGLAVSIWEICHSSDLNINHQNAMSVALFHEAWLLWPSAPALNEDDNLKLLYILCFSIVLFYEAAYCALPYNFFRSCK